mgnify:FL=1|jgi:hypothetical protein
MISQKYTDEYEVSDACPEAMQAGGKAEFDEKFEKWKVKQANIKPTWRWVKEDEE